MIEITEMPSQEEITFEQAIEYEAANIPTYMIILSHITGFGLSTYLSQKVNRKYREYSLYKEEKDEC